MLICHRRARAALDPERLSGQEKLIRGVPCLLLGHSVGHLRLWCPCGGAGRPKGGGGLAISGFFALHAAGEGASAAGALWL